MSVEARDLVTVAVDDFGGLTYQISVGVGVVGQVGQPAVDVADHADAKRYARDKQKAQNESKIMGRTCVLERLRPCRWRGPIY